jgi:H+/Cl- antiporter ClcA
VFGAFMALVFMGVIGFGGGWYADANPGWFGGQWWWVAVTAGAGVVVGLLRRLVRLPEEIPGLIHDLQEGHVDPRLVPGIAVVSAVSLIGGASLGPEKALGALGGGAGSWIAQRRRLSREDAQLCTLSGFGGAYGGLFSSTVIVVMFILELARPGGHRFAKPWSAKSWPRASRSGSTSPSPGQCSSTPIRCRSTRSRIGSCWRGSRWACSRPSW